MTGENASSHPGRPDVCSPDQVSAPPTLEFPSRLPQRALNEAIPFGVTSRRILGNRHTASPRIRATTLFSLARSNTGLRTDGPCPPRARLTPGRQLLAHLGAPAVKQQRNERLHTRTRTTNTVPRLLHATTHQGRFGLGTRLGNPLHKLLRFGGPLAPIARTTSRARALGLTSSGYVLFFLRRAVTVMPSPCSAATRVVSAASTSGSPVATSYRSFGTPKTMSCNMASVVETGSSLSAHACGSTLQHELHPCACCAVRDGHTFRHVCNRRKSRKRRNKRTRARGDSMRVGCEDGKGRRKRHTAPSPLWDLDEARKLRSTPLVASCCHLGSSTSARLSLITSRAKLHAPPK